jgi:hypothetical protein
MNDLIGSLLSMKLDVYKQIDRQDPNTGAIKKEWIFFKTVNCHAKGVISNSATARGSDSQTFSNKYKNEQIVQIRTIDRLTNREKITNIRDSSDNVIWKELDFPSDTPTVFEIIGTTPLTDPFGKTIGFNSSVMRSENQQIGL